MNVSNVLKAAAGLPLLVRELAGVRAELRRLADLYEADLAERGIRLRPADSDAAKSEDADLEAIYTDEELDLAREIADLHSSKVQE